MITHNVCIGTRIRKTGIPLHTPVLYTKVGFSAVYITRTCFRDDDRPSMCGPYGTLRGHLIIADVLNAVTLELTPKSLRHDYNLNFHKIRAFRFQKILKLE